MSLQGLLELMSRALEGISGLPWGVHVAVALALGAGIIIWLAGEKFLKHMVIFVCAGVGAVLGLLLTSSTPWGQSGSLSAYHHLFIGLGAGIIAGFLVFRSAAALAMGVVLAALLPLGTAAIINVTDGRSGPSRDDDQEASLIAPLMDTEQPGVVISRVAWESALAQSAPTIQEDDTPREGAVPPASGVVERARESFKVERVPENLRPGVEAVASFWSTLSGEAHEGWNRWSGRDKAILATVGALGLAIGVIWGMSVPRWSGVAISAMFGSAVWLPAFVWLSNAMSAPWNPALDMSPLRWLGVWGCVGVIGMAVQYSGLIPGTRPKAGGAAPAAKPPK